MSGWRRIRGMLALARYANALLRDPVDARHCQRIVRERTTGRTGALLETLDRVFGWPDSPYRPLLDGAGYDLARARTLVSAGPLEEGLRRLAADGVYVTIDEFRGKREIVRDRVRTRVSEMRFRNPWATSGLVVSTGGTRSTGIATTISPSNLRLGAEHLCLALDAYGLGEAAAAVWLPTAHGASLWAILAFAVAGRVPERWFTLLAPTVDRTGYWYARYLGLRIAARWQGLGIPRATQVAVGEEGPILAWIAGRAGPGRPVVIFTTPTCALRLARSATRARQTLAAVTFITIGEPLTRAKMAAITEVGARAFSSLGFTELGRATYGCASPASVDDGHLCLDAVAVIDRPRTIDRAGTEVDALLFTTLLADSRTLLLNVETGDYGALSTRSCGCLLEGAGWPQHLSGIRSFEKLNAEGMLAFGSSVIGLIEETLPERFGGDLTDFQLVEHEDGTGATRLTVRVHPRLGQLDEAAVLACVEEELLAHDQFPSRVWISSGTFTVERAEPIVTKAGKLMPLHHLR